MTPRQKEWRLSSEGRDWLRKYQSKYRKSAKNRAYCKRRYKQTAGLRERVVAVSRKARLKRIYNISLEEYDRIISSQGGVCAGCLRPRCPTGKKLSVDHRHSDGLIRGGLCYLCNRLLGLANDNSDLLLRLSQYLLNPPATLALGEQRFGLPGRVDTKKQRKLLKKAKKFGISPYLPAIPIENPPARQVVSR